METNGEVVPNNHSSEYEAKLRDMYVKEKFKAYLQTTLRMTRKAYLIKLSKYRKCTVFMDDDTLHYFINRNCTRTEEDYSSLYWAIGQLNAEQEMVIRSYYFRGMTNEEIARNRSVSRQAIEAMRHRGLHTLRELLRTRDEG